MEQQLDKGCAFTDTRYELINGELMAMSLGTGKYGNIQLGNPTLVQSLGFAFR